MQREIKVIKFLLMREVKRRISLLRNPTDKDIVNIVATAFNELMNRNLNRPCSPIARGTELKIQ